VLGDVFQIRSADDYPLQYRVWRGNGDVRSTLVLLNGVMSHSGWFDRFASMLVPHGFKVVGADRRGTGTNEKDRGDAPSAKALVDDVRAIIDKEQVRDRPLHLAGWCWGGVLAINTAFELGSSLSSLILLAPGLFSTEALKANMARQDPNGAWFENPIEEEMFTRGPLLDGFIRKDPLRTQQFSARFQQVMAKMGMSAQVRLPKIEAPILLILAEDDRATDNDATKKAFERLPPGRATIETVKSAHGIHFEQPEALVESIVRFTKG
jgi:lysophospholipase